MAIFLFILMPAVAGAGGGEGIPLGFLFAQVFNFILFVLILFFLLRKKIPVFLKQKQEDFLEYRKKAKDLEQKHQADCLALQEKIHNLMNKQKNIKTTVAKAVHHQEKEMAEELEHQLKNLKTRAEQELKRARLKKTNQLRAWFLSQVMVQAREQIKAEVPAKKEALNQHIIQKWEQI